MGGEGDGKGARKVMEGEGELRRLCRRLQKFTTVQVHERETWIGEGWRGKKEEGGG
jgi:hypothetical protein